MSTLIISLPLEAVTAQTEFDFVVTDDGVAVAKTGRALAAALPLLDKPGDVCIATAPVRVLSWHQVTVPVGVTPGSARMRLVLDGLLEDKLLDDPGLLHIALPPNSQFGMAQWVAVCDRRWLAMAVQGLEVAKRPVSRVVPEWGPPAAPLRWHVTGTAEDPQLVVCGDSGVGIFPLKTAVLESFDLADNVSAEPALVALASQILQRPIVPLLTSERMIQTTRSFWDVSKRLQMRQLANRGKLEWLQAPRWRSARWALMALLGINLLGLNALAWLGEHQLAVQRDAMKSMLTRSFPNLKSIIDVPVQMAREVRLLEQASAAPTAVDLDVMLGVLSRSLPAGQTLKGVDYASGQLRLSGLELNANEARALTVSLQAQGYSASREGVTWLMQPAASAGTL
ncbi:MAG: type II secretion system protein GspL [Polaromonas sp.]|jgi:general secretion pathway protein L|nr:type II secretion system protein GspL [Polaromonas sp.]